MDESISRIRENEGVVHTVRSKELGYPCEPLVPNYELLDDARCWEDIEANTMGPLLQNDCLFRIRSDKTDEQISRYLEFLMSSCEYSARGVYIASLAIIRNPANYSAWAYRMECSERLQLSLQSEMDFARRVAFESPKSYQAWRYRRWLCEMHKSPHNEVEFVKLEIATSPKNHCAWGHMTWLMHNFEVSKEQVHKELEFLSFLLESDVYNNTAWVYKSYILGSFGSMLEDVDLVQGYITDFRTMLSSPWNESLSQYLVEGNKRLSELYNGCLKLDSCSDKCIGGPSNCFIKAIDAFGVVTNALLMLMCGIMPDCEERLQVLVDSGLVALVVASSFAVSVAGAFFAVSVVEAFFAGSVVEAFFAGSVVGAFFAGSVAAAFFADSVIGAFFAVSVAGAFFAGSVVEAFFAGSVVGAFFADSVIGALVSSNSYTAVANERVPLLSLIAAIQSRDSFKLEGTSRSVL
ncbi:prenyltransferase alpha subunit repeat domain containing protein [Babesia ovis]|uniref:Protein farnesyltransferase/geranylgeranyltransferase type-1 subunit alpha n=1 Tax=Babesia ovis TaxID=5869 RepID=A0A9W5WTI2_BABOV|nr:prenyltransferase alpha subunit repeat domain containing protein [Babesia ovis]